MQLQSAIHRQQQKPVSRTVSYSSAPCDLRRALPDSVPFTFRPKSDTSTISSLTNGSSAAPLKAASQDNGVSLSRSVNKVPFGSGWSSSSPRRMTAGTSEDIINTLRSSILEVCRADDNSVEPNPEKVGDCPKVQKAIHALVVAAELDRGQFTQVLVHGKARKNVTLPTRAVSWMVFTGAFPSPSVINRLDMSLYSPKQVTALANIFCDDTDFSIGDDAATAIPTVERAQEFLSHLFAGKEGADSKARSFSSLSILEMSPIRLCWEPPEVIQEWVKKHHIFAADEMGAFENPDLSFYRSDVSYPMFVSHKLWDAQRVITRLGELAQPDNFHPAIINAMLAHPHRFEDQDLVDFADRFRLGPVRLESACNDMQHVARVLFDVPAIFSIQCLTAPGKLLVKHDHWVPLIMERLNGFKSSREILRFMALSTSDQQQTLAEHVHNCWLFEGHMWTIKWASLKSHYVAWAHASFRLYNMFETNVTSSFEVDKMRQQILSALLLNTRLDEKVKLQRVADQLDLLRPCGLHEPLPLRAGSSWEFGPCDGQRYDITQPLLGPATESCRRVRMDWATGNRYLMDSTAEQRPYQSTIPRATHLAPSANGLVQTPLLQVQSRNPVHHVPHVDWALRALGDANAYLKRADDSRVAFTVDPTAGLDRRLSAVFNSLRTTSEYKSTAPSAQPNSDAEFRGVYKYIRGNEIGPGQVILLVDAFSFIERAATAGLAPFDFPLSAYSSSPIRAHAYVDELSEEGVLSCRTLFVKPVNGLSQTELTSVSDQQGIWPPEDKSWNVKLPANCGFFAIRHLRDFMRCLHPHFDMRGPPVEVAPPLDEFQKLLQDLQPEPPPTRAPSPSAQVPPARPAAATFQPPRQSQAHQPEKTGGTKKAKRARDGASSVQLEPVRPLETANDAKRQRQSFQKARSATPATPTKSTTSSAKEKNPAYPHGSVLELGERKFNRLMTELQLTIPVRPTVHTPLLCLNSWAASRTEQTASVQPWRANCNVPGCFKLHVEGLSPGVVSYESVRFQIVYFNMNKSAAVADLLDLVDTEGSLFPPEKDIWRVPADVQNNFMFPFYMQITLCFMVLRQIEAAFGTATDLMALSDDPSTLSRQDFTRVLYEAFKANSNDFGEAAAVKWAAGFTIPLKAVQQDTDALLRHKLANGIEIPTAPTFKNMSTPPPLRQKYVAVHPAVDRLNFVQWMKGMARTLWYIDDCLGVAKVSFYATVLRIVVWVITTLLGPAANNVKKEQVGRRMDMLGWHMNLDTMAVTISERNMQKAIY
eukprot:gene30502-37730_t